MRAVGGALGMQLSLWRGCKGKKRQRQHSPHDCTASPDRGAQPWLGGSAHAGSDPARPRRRLARLFLANTSSLQLQQDTMILSSAFLETPSSQGYVIGTSKVPFLREKTKNNQPSDGSALLPSRSFQTLFHFQILHFMGTLGGAMGAHPHWVSSPLG